MKTTSLLFILTACGGGSSPQPATPVAPEPTPVSEPTPPAPPAEPAAEPAPAEPAGPDPAKIKADLLAMETGAYEKSKPVFEKYCVSCHSQGQKKAKKATLEHFDITSYPFGGHHAMELGKEVRKVLAIGGGKPTMPKGKPGAVKGEELALVAAWADAFDAAHAGGAHEGHQGHDGGHHHDAPKPKDAPKPHGHGHKH